MDGWRDEWMDGRINKNIVSEKELRQIIMQVNKGHVWEIFTSQLQQNTYFLSFHVSVWKLTNWLLYTLER